MSKPAPRNPTQQRLREMEVLLRWEGELDNARLREVFGVQAVQASRLLSAFVAAYGPAITRVSPHAPVTPTKQFRPRLAGNSPDEYLRLVDSVGPLVRTFAVEDLRLDLSPVSSTLFALATKACLKRVGLQIRYRSLSEPDGRDRLVYPHSLIRAARRWHVRAWCTQRAAFRDYALGRISKGSIEGSPSPATKEADQHWNEMAKLEVVAHPALPTGQLQLLQDEYLGGATSRTVEVRRCLVGYTVQDLRLATDARRHMPPEFQLLLKNAADFKDDFVVRSAA
ncbi:WYL domain-containing protein [uncultured Piscinibacter sp.]|mgnify:CR=1 FL=1|uniref:WYL domain-containing protein n=1 Tax=uncultured Piscinibacter sp. TaxID=1131835 RepID=UPI002605CBB7|nr:WYL domain-containing protein [uncultured Piscinibacter sp.]